MWRRKRRRSCGYHAGISTLQNHRETLKELTNGSIWWRRRTGAGLFCNGAKMENSVGVPRSFLLANDPRIDGVFTCSLAEFCLQCHKMVSWTWAGEKEKNADGVEQWRFMFFIAVCVMKKTLMKIPKTKLRFSILLIQFIKFAWVYPLHSLASVVSDAMQGSVGPSVRW